MGLPAIKIKRRGVVARRAETKDELYGGEPPKTQRVLKISNFLQISVNGIRIWPEFLMGSDTI